ncbi:MAG: hypothetical protein JWM34_2708 [Ilumatobacteraceae bacterium]|nr:hypothetical protein [Ilumatobacteraceae bacterium]
MATATGCEVDEVLAALSLLATVDESTLDRSAVQAGLRVVARVHGIADVVGARLTRWLATLAESEASMFPEADVAAAARSSRGTGDRATKRAKTLGEVPELEAALGAGEVSLDHVDAVTRVLKRLSAADRSALAADGARLAAMAAGSTPEQFEKRLKREIARRDPREGAARLAAQQRANRLRHWTDEDTGMVIIRGEFDPETGIRLIGTLESTVEAMFHGGVPDSCPTGEGRQDHLRALALVGLVDGAVGRGARPTAGSGSASASASASDGPSSDGDGGTGAEAWTGDIVSVGDRVDVIVVIDLETLLHGEHARSCIDNGFGVELPVESYRRWACTAGIIPMVLNSDGVVLDEGRRVRLANRAQRRALRAMYSTCAIPGCRVWSRHCQPHHIRWWDKHFGPTDLANLVPLCSRHHHAVHEGGWQIELHPDRSLTVTYPDGVVRTTGPPSRRRAA